ncbi:aspartate kinase [Thermodesulfatator indicus DSM 15286]|uniref:Aspartokinase n=1 Tax=Thermodesulfatator indicus (strain DSM 15286 / JCM 11887 / CIR29812) TaxID=667014 RepID=F8A9Y5_THEID|nr:aspartate kinase [Thermodesulfatator indicus]AEH44187.1 aspartate kinase [Thermodesulfatator indicus DSM 15286]
MLVVQKYGGTSVGDLDRIRNVARRIARYRDEGHDVVVVVSAMAGETDRLLKLAYNLVEEPSPRELDMLVSTGEQVSSALLAMALNAMGYSAKALLAFQIPIKTDELFGKARIRDVATARLKEEIANGNILIIAGFQGITDSGDITTLGRGGSDTTAVAIAAALGADVCEIFTDVDGVYTADPRIVPKARKIEKISYEEMLELASMGAKVLEIRSVEFAKIYGVPVHVRSSFTDEPGTMVVEEDESMEKVLVSGVAYNRNEARISLYGVPDRPGLAAKIFGTIADAGIVVDMIIQTGRPDGRADMTFTVPKTDYKATLKLVDKLAPELSIEKIEGDEDIAKVSIVGAGMRAHPGVAAKMFQVLADHGINIHMISTSEIKVSCVIDEKYTELAVRALHEAFGLDRAPEEETL